MLLVWLTNGSLECAFGVLKFWSHLKAVSSVLFSMQVVFSIIGVACSCVPGVLGVLVTCKGCAFRWCWLFNGSSE